MKPQLALCSTSPHQSLMHRIRQPKSARNEPPSLLGVSRRWMASYPVPPPPHRRIDANRYAYSEGGSTGPQHDVHPQTPGQQRLLRSLRIMMWGTLVVIVAPGVIAYFVYR